MNKPLSYLLLSLFGLAISNQLIAQSWAYNPIVFSQLPGKGYDVQDMKMDNSGRLVLVGTRNYQPDGTFEIRPFILRLNTDGTPDISFSGDGLVDNFNPSAYSDYVMGMDIQADGKIIVCGNAGGYPMVARLNANGTLDTSFGTNGVVTLTAYGGLFNDVLYEAGTGKIIAAGYRGVGSNDSDLLAARFTANGAKDFTFNNDGVWDDFTYWADDLVGPKSIVRTADGSYWMCGYSNPNGTTNNDAILLKLTPSGFLDLAGFPPNGYWISFVSVEDHFNEMIQLSNGNILMVGHGYSTPDHYIWLRLCDANGTYITGRYYSQLGDASSIDGMSLAQQCDGKVVVLAKPEGTKTVLFRVNSSDLSIDPTFGVNGFFEAQIGYSTDLPTKLIVKDESIYICGETYASSANFYQYPYFGKLDNTITINAPGIAISPSNPNTTNIICPGANKILAASGNCPTCNIEWYLNGVLVGTGSNFTATLPGNYTAKYKNPTCGSSVASNTIVLTAGTTPPTPCVSPANNASVCLGSPYQLTASCSGTGNTYLWLPSGSGSGGTLSVNTAIQGVTTYNAIAQTNVGQCPSAPSNAVTVTVTQPTNLAPIISPSGPISLCNGSSTTLTVTNTPPANHTIRWSDNSTGQTLMTDLPGTFFAVFVQGGCAGPSSPQVSVTQTHVPVPVVSASFNVVCNNIPVSLTATGCPTCTTSWYEVGMPGVLATGSTYYADQSGDYYAVYTENGCIGANSQTIHIDEGTHPILTLTTDGLPKLCPGQTIAIFAQSSGSQINWYDANTNSYLGSGNQILVGPGYYKAETSNECGVSYSMVLVEEIPPFTFDLIEVSTGSGTDICALTGGILYTWYQNGQILSSLTDNCLHDVVSGAVYTVTMTLPDGCTGTSNPLIHTSVGDLLEVQLHLFPNPTTDGLTITLPEAIEGEVCISLKNAQGKMLEESILGELNGAQQIFYASHLPRGIYWLSVRAEDKIWIAQFVKI